MDPAVGLLRSLPIIQPGKAPGMLQGVPIVEDFTAPHKHLAPVPDPLGSIPHNHYHGGAVSNQPNSRNCAYRRAKMASASPRQLPRKRRTTVWRPGEASTRSLGNSGTPVLTSWNGPRSELAREDGVGIPQATPQKATHHRMASGRGFHPFAGQQQHPGFDLLEWALLHRWQGRKRLGTRAPPALLTHLHAQHAAIHTQHHGWRSLPCGGTFPATVGMVSAHPFAITGGRLAQSLDYLPNAHGADFDAPQQPGPLRRQRVPLPPARPTGAPANR